MKFKYLYIIILILALIPLANAAAPVADFNGNETTGQIPLNILFTDATTNTPTGWSWLFGDDNYNQYWVRQNASAGWLARTSPSLVGLPDGSIVLYGGYNGGTKYNDTWRSTDNGATWVLQNSTPGWLGRQGQSGVVLSDGSIIMVGGLDAVRRNDTWRSTDNGVTWVRQNATNASWMAKEFQTLITTSNGDLLLLGGRNNTNTSGTNDTWKSTDKGVTWTQVNGSCGWSARYFPTVLLSQDGSIILYGGQQSAAIRFNDTWRSTDNGATWTNITPSSTFPPTGRTTSGSVVLPNGNFLLTGGSNGTKSNDTWISNNSGVTWRVVNSSGKYLARNDFGLAIMSDGGIILAGGSDTGTRNDVWRYFPYSSTTQNPTHIFTVARKYNVTLRAYNADGYNDTTLTDYITATNGTVSASFTSDVTSGYSPLVVAFTDLSSNSPTTWKWNATNITPGNNTPFTFNITQNPIHTFGVGNWSIKLNASDGVSFNTTPGMYFINVSLLAPVPNSSFTTNATSGVEVAAIQFNDTSTGPPTSWVWNATNITGNNTPFTFSNIQNATYTFGLGNWSIKLYTSNTGGNNISAQITFINVSARLIPVASFTSNKTSGVAPLPVQFNDTSTNSPTQWVWFFGDENYNQEWVQVNDSGNWTRRISFPSVVLSDGSIILMGGADGTGDKNDTWRSADNGTTWVLMNASSEWNKRSGHTAVALADDSIILMGGTDGAVKLNDVWKSTDKGITWTQQTASAGWSARYYHTSIVASDGSIILMGGSAASFTGLNDTWRSTDQGVTWTLMNASSGWSPRYAHTSVVSLTNIILLGGATNSSAKLNDTWRSTNNGATWTQMNASSQWSKRAGFASVSMPDNTIVLMGGIDTELRNDTWKSTDNGISWVLTNASSKWTARRDLTGVVTRDGSIILMGGNDATGSKNDTWKFPVQGAVIQNPVHTYTIAGNFSVLLRSTNAFGSNITPGKYYINVSAAPISNFTSNVTIATIYPMVVQFYDTSINFPTQWNWSFGDGRWFNTTNISLNNPIYTYAVAGKYAVNLTTSNTLGSNTKSVTEYINLTSDTDNNITSWLHMNGTNGTTTFRDETGQAWATLGNAKIVTNNFKYGGASGYFDGAGDYISTSLPSAFNFTTNDFTIEFWVNVTAITGTNDHIISKTNNPRTRGWGLDCSGGNDAGWDFWMGNDTTGETPYFTIPNKTWTHIAIERQGGTLYVYVNGNLSAQRSGYNANYNTADPLWIARQGTSYFNGYIDEFRVSNNVSRWKANFTPPYNEYRGLLETLYFDENPNSTFRYKTNPGGIAYVDNQTPRNRTLQIENVTNTSYVTGSMLFQPRYGVVKSVQLNTSTYGTGMSIVCATIDNTNGIIEFNISRPIGFNNGSVRASIFDYTFAYTNYTDGTDPVNEYFGYGYLINTTINKYYPVHNFLGTSVTYGDWNFTANFTATDTTFLAGNLTTFVSTFNGSYPNRWNWSFGDGTFDNGTNSTTVHRYTMGGNHTVTLTEYLWQNISINSTKTRTNYINVTNIIPSASFTSISSGGPLPPVTVQFTDTSANSPMYWNWSLGDGNVSALQSPLHIYNVCGNLTVLLRVENTAGVDWENKTDYLNIPCFIPTPPPSPDQRIAFKMEEIGDFIWIAAIILSVALVATFIYMWINRRSK